MGLALFLGGLISPSSSLLLLLLLFSSSSSLLKLLLLLLFLLLGGLKSPTPLLLLLLLSLLLLKLLVRLLLRLLLTSPPSPLSLLVGLKSSSVSLLFTVSQLPVFPSILIFFFFPNEELLGLLEEEANCFICFFYFTV